MRHRPARAKNRDICALRHLRSREARDYSPAAVGLPVPVCLASRTGDRIGRACPIGVAFSDTGLPRHGFTVNAKRGHRFWKW